MHNDCCRSKKIYGTNQTCTCGGYIKLLLILQDKVHSKKYFDWRGFFVYPKQSVEDFCFDYKHLNDCRQAALLF